MRCENQTDADTANHTLAKGGKLFEVFLSLQNPLIHDQENSEFRDTQFSVLVERAKANRHDGLIIRNTEDPALEGDDYDPQADIYVAFAPTQIKSATENNGDFDPTNPDIRFSRAEPVDTPAFKQ